MRFHHRSLAALCLINLGLAPGFALADAFSDKTAPSFPQIGDVTKAFPTDALCTLSYRKQIVFIDLYPENEFWMNLDGQDVKLVPLSSKKNGYKFKFANTLIHVKYGSAIEIPPPGEMGMDGTIFKKPKIIFIKGKQKLTLKATGGCDGGAGNQE